MRLYAGRWALGTSPSARSACHTKPGQAGGSRVRGDGLASRQLQVLCTVVPQSHSAPWARAVAPEWPALCGQACGARSARVPHVPPEPFLTGAGRGCACEAAAARGFPRRSLRGFQGQQHPVTSARGHCLGGQVWDWSPSCARRGWTRREVWALGGQRSGPAGEPGASRQARLVLQVRHVGAGVSCRRSGVTSAADGTCC